MASYVDLVKKLREDNASTHGGATNQTRETDESASSYVALVQKLRGDGLNINTKSAVNGNYIHSFLGESHQLLQSAKATYENLTWETVNNNWAQDNADYKERSKRIRAYFNSSLNEFDEATTQNVLSYLDAFDQDYEMFSQAFQEEKEKANAMSGGALFYDRQKTETPLIETMTGQSRFAQADRWLADATAKAQQAAAWQQEYSGKEYDWLKGEIARAEFAKDTTRAQWLTEYAKSVMTKDDKQRVIQDNKEKIQALEAVLEEYAMIADQSQGGVQTAVAREKQLKQLYGSQTDIQAKINQLQNENWNLEKDIAYSNLDKSTDFNEKSQYVSTLGELGLYQTLVDPTKPAYADEKYEYINKNQEAIRQINMHQGATEFRPVTLKQKYGLYDLMTEEEVAVYNYLYATQGKTEAEDYLSYLEYALNERDMEQYRKETAQFADGVGGGIAASALSVPLNLMGGIGLLDAGLQKAGKEIKEAVTGEYAGPVDYNRPAMRASIGATTIRNTVAGNIADATGVITIDPEKNPTAAKLLNGKSLGDVYQLGMSMADSGAAAAISSVAGPLGTVLLGSSAGTQAMLEAVADGATDSQALKKGAAAGLFEMLFEKLSIDNLLKGEAKNWVVALFKQGGIEASEEMATSLANQITDTVVMAEKSDKEKSIATYMEQGMSREEAEKQALIDACIEIGWDGVGGFFSGGIMGGGGHAIGQRNAEMAQYAQIGETINTTEGGVDALLNFANEIAPTQSSKTQQQIAKLTEKANAGNNHATGKLYNVVQQAVTAQDQADIVQHLEKSGMSSKTAKQVTQIVTDRMNGVKLSESQEDLFRTLIKDSRVENVVTAIADNFAASGSRRQQLAAILKGKTTKAASAETQVEESDESKQMEETHYEVSAEGKTIRKSDGEIVNINGIASIEKGKMVFETDDGTVDSSELDYATRDEVLVYGAVASLSGIIDTETANRMVKHLLKLGDTSSGEYISGIVKAYTYGYYGYGREAMSQDGTPSVTLSEKQRNVAYGLGEQYRDSKTNYAQKKVKERSVSKGKYHKEFTQERNGVHYDDVDISKMRLNAKQRTGIQLAEFLAAIGMDVHIYESKVVNGKRVGDNGVYYGKDGSIHIDIAAGNKGEGLVAYAISHEFTHFIQDWSPAKFKVFANALFDELGKSKVDVDNMINRTLDRVRNMEEYKGKTETELLDIVYAEVVAECCETMLTDTDAAIKIADRIKATDSELLNKIIEFFDKLLTKLKNLLKANVAYRDASPDNVIANEARDTIKNIERLRDLFADAAVDAAATFRNAEQKNTSEDGGVKMMVRENVVDSKKNVARKKKSYYNENETLFMIWAHGSAQAGEVRRFVRFGKIHYYEKTEEYCVELSRAQYGERRKFNAEDIDRKAERAVSEAVNSNGSAEGRTAGHSNSNRNAGGTDAVSKQSVGEELRNDLERSVRGGTGSNYGDTIRRQQRTEDAVSNRSLLANALERVARNNIEKQKIQEYKGKVDLINAEEKKLRELNEQIKALSFAKGPRDTEKIRDLRIKAKQTANRINTYDKQLLRLEASKPLQDVLQREKKAAYERAEQKGKEALEAYREKAMKNQQELLEKWQTSRKKGVDSRRKTAMRQKIRKVIRDLNKILNRGTKERNVKEDMKDLVSKAIASAEFLFMDNYTDEDIIRNGIQTPLFDHEQEIFDKSVALLKEMDSASAEDMDRLKRKLAGYKKQLANAFLRERLRIDGTTAASLISDLADAYADIKKSPDPYVQNAYESVVYDQLKDLREKIGVTRVKDMSLEQLEELYKAYRKVMTTVQNANKLFREGKAEDLRELVQRVYLEIRKIRSSEKDPGAAREKVGKWLRDFSWNELRPVDAFARVGSDSFTQLFWDVIQAQDQFGHLVTEIEDVITGARKRHHYSKWDLNTAMTYETVDGKKFKVTLADAMSIYAYSKRDQAHDHITEGGFTFDTGRTYSDKEGGKKKVHKVLSTPYRVTDVEIGEIIASLTEEQKAYVDEVQKFLTEFGQKGNEVSRILWGIDIFTEKVYFPLMSSKDYRSSTEEALNNTQTMVSLKNTGMTKQTVPHANNPIVLRAFDDVVLEHLDSMAKYVSYVLPIENLQKVFNSVARDSNDNYISTQALISSVFGTSATNYFNQYIKDINGNTSATGAKSPIAGFFSKSKAAAVAANLSVVAQQYSAVNRAMSEVAPKYFTPLTKAVKATTKVYDELKKYAGVAIIKEMGGFDVGSNRGIKDYIGMNEAPASFDKAWKKFQDITGWGASMMDKAGWITIWNAVKKEVAAKKKYTVGSEAFLRECGRRFTEVVTKTQVYDSVNSRSGFMRSKADSVKYLTTYMGEPTVTIGMTYMSHLELLRAIQSKDSARIKNAVRKHARTSAVLLTTMVLNGVMKSFVYAMRDDEEDEAFMERWAKQLGMAVAGDLNPFSMLPVFRDIISLIEGWDVERPDMTVIADFISAVQRAADKVFDYENYENMKQEDWWTLAKNLIGSIGNMVGVPAKNVIRDIDGIVRVTGEVTDDLKPEDIGGSFVRGFTGTERGKKETLYDAIVNGEETRVDELAAGYADEAAYETAIKQALRENDPRILTAAEARYAGEFAEYERIFGEIEAEGHFTRSQIAGAINAEVAALEPTEETTSSAKVYGMYGKDDYALAIRSGDEDRAMAIAEEIIRTEVANGKDEAVAHTNLEEATRKQVKEWFFADEITEEEAIKLMKAYGGYDSAESKKKAAEWSFEQDTGVSYADRVDAYRDGQITAAQLKRSMMEVGGKSASDADWQIKVYDWQNEGFDISDTNRSVVEDYETFCKPAGIQKAVYYDAYLFYQNAGEEGVSYSKTKECMPYIDALPLTDAQKDALALCWWSEKTVNKYKTW